MEKYDHFPLRKLFLKYLKNRKYADHKLILLEKLCWHNLCRILPRYVSKYCNQILFNMNKPAVHGWNIARHQIFLFIDKIPSAEQRGSFLSWSGDSTVVEWWIHDHWFKSQQECQDSFLLQGQHSVLTLILVSVPPPCYCSSTRM